MKSKMWCRDTGSGTWTKIGWRSATWTLALESWLHCRLFGCVAAQWGNSAAVTSRWREQNCKRHWKYFNSWSFQKGIQKCYSSEKPLFSFIREKKPPLSLRRTCCWQTPPLNHNLWLVLWGRMEKCNQVQNANTSLWGDRHPISKQPLKGPYGISRLIWSNKKQENPTANTCRVLLLPVSLGQCVSLSRCSLLRWEWAVGMFSTLGVLLHFIIIILTKKLATWSIWGGYGFETDVKIIWKHEGQAVEHFQDCMKH